MWLRFATVVNSDPHCINLLLQIFESNKTCEIDPVKLKEGDNVEVNKVRWGLCFD